MQHLDHDLAVEGSLAGEEHAAHPSAAELVLDGENFPEGMFQSLAQLTRCHELALPNQGHPAAFTLAVPEPSARRLRSLEA